MHRSFRIILILLIIALFLCGCSKNPTQTPPPATEPSTAPTVDPNKPLTELTDYELLRTMAEKKACWDWLTCSYMGEYPFSSLMSFSPEFTELMTRPTAADSIKTYIGPLMEQYPDSAINSLTYHISDIEAYLSENVTK
ncbi:MAG: hypothetical protein IJO72_04905 [Oscillospiraceae bacterium]|nr:hypothetical protein [Oscillospiraceae bacterium]